MASKVVTFEVLGVDEQAAIKMGKLAFEGQFGPLKVTKTEVRPFDVSVTYVEGDPKPVWFVDVTYEDQS